MDGRDNETSESGGTQPSPSSPSLLAEPTHDARLAALADASLFGVAVLWGFNFVAIKYVVDRMDPTLFLLLRYWVAFFMLAVIMPRSLRGTTRRDWFYGSLLGFFYFTALVVQSYGLQLTTPGKSGFITGMNVAMVPFIYWAVTRRSPGGYQILGALVAAVGLGVLSLRGDLTMGLGDSVTLISALFYAMHIAATGFWAPQVRPATLAITQILASAVLCTILAPFVTDFTLDLDWRLWGIIVWMALSGTIVAFLVQSWAQRHTTSTHAGVLLSLEAVFAVLFGVIFGFDSVTWRLLAGGVLILAGILETLPARNAGVVSPQAEREA